MGRDRPRGAQYAAAIGMTRDHSAHSMRATFITTALENGAELEDVQKAAGHRDPGTTRLYDRRGYNREGESFFATY
jgi:site-specific recombinase XerD